jgi:NADPH:quinone reductase-like Zn-dependent oxidoreductase
LLERETLKAIVVRDWDPKTSTLEEVETPGPGEGDVLIRARDDIAAAILFEKRQQRADERHVPTFVTRNEVLTRHAYLRLE